MGAWIEMLIFEQKSFPASVAPLVGAWIEIRCIPVVRPFYRSLPLWERGLKSPYNAIAAAASDVAPLVGAWIEMDLTNQLMTLQLSRSPCGSVD